MRKNTFVGGKMEEFFQGSCRAPMILSLAHPAHSLCPHLPQVGFLKVGKAEGAGYYICFADAILFLALILLLGYMQAFHFYYFQAFHREPCKEGNYTPLKINRSRCPFYFPQKLPFLIRKL